MATTSTVPTVIDALLARLATAGVTAFESWPGPEAAREMLVLGEVDWDDYRVASIKPGRQQRQEDYAVAFELFVMGRAGTTPSVPKAARDRAFVILGLVEDVLATNWTLSTAAATVQRVELRVVNGGPRVFEKGWAWRIAGRFDVYARLT